MPWPVLLVSGSESGVGKTAWIEALTAAFAARGHRVAVIKHHGHTVLDYAADYAAPAEGAVRLRSGRAERVKDTERARRAGAALRVLVGEGMLLWENDTPWDTAAALTVALRSLGLAGKPPDVVLAEGFRSVGGYPRLWVVGPTQRVPLPAGLNPPVGDEAATFVVEGEAQPDEAHVRAVLAWLTRHGFPEGAVPGGGREGDLPPD